MATVAIVGSGIVGTTIAYHLAQHGHTITIFEKGRQQPSRSDVYQAQIHRAGDGRTDLPFSLSGIVASGQPPLRVGNDLRMEVGGMAHTWEGISIRLRPSDFQTQTLFGRDMDWAIDYDTLEPYYSEADAFLGISGTDDDNPFAPPRSTDYPLPHFELGYYDRVLAERLEGTLHVHTTPQARTSEAYDGRPACQNIGMCHTCPINVRYSPVLHLNRAIETGNVTLQDNTSVRRIIIENGRAIGVEIQENDSEQSEEFFADVVIVAAGAIPSAHLLLLSDVGNSSGHVGQHLTFHHLYGTRIRFRERIYGGRYGFWTMQSEQYTDHNKRQEVGGFKIEFLNQRRFEQFDGGIKPEAMLRDTDDNILNQLDGAYMMHHRTIIIHAETDTSPNKYLSLSETNFDPFGDPMPHVHYELTPFDEATYDFSQEVTTQIANKLRSRIVYRPRLEEYATGWHHMGTARMSNNPDDGVVDSFGKVHDTDNLFVIGSSMFATSGTVNPTLTITALTLRAKDYLVEMLGEM